MMAFAIKFAVSVGFLNAPMGFGTGYSANDCEDI